MNSLDPPNAKYDELSMGHLVVFGQKNRVLCLQSIHTPRWPGVQHSGDYGTDEKKIQAVYYDFCYAVIAHQRHLMHQNMNHQLARLPC